MSLENFGAYQLLKRLAVGGMAEIFLARQQGVEGFERLVVVKRILPQLAQDQEFVRMFLDEARIAARLDHPNIVQIHDLGEAHGTYFIAMEYIHGEDLRRVWRRAEAQERALPLAVVFRIVMDVAAGLDHAHRRTDERGQAMGIVHRDVSPQNILVTFAGGVKIVDFGIAKAVGKATQTRSGVLKGKYSYMSPEQAATLPVDRRSDLFALGVVLFELLTGIRLFKRATDLQTLNAVADCRIPAPSTVRPGLPKELDALVLKALAREPQDRFQDGAELIAALEQWLVVRRLPSSSAEVAAFMRELYRDRMKRERAQGRVLLEDIGEQAPRSGSGVPAAPTTQPQPTEGSSTSPKLEPEPETHVESRPDSAVVGAPERTHPSVAQTSATQLVPLPAGQKLLLASIGLITLGTFGAAAALLSSRASVAAEVRIQTDPPGATVVFDGRPLAELTPCTLPPAKAGRHALWVGKPGYLDASQELVIPPTGQVTFPAIRLQPAPAPSP